MLEALLALGGAGAAAFNGGQLARRRPRLNNAKRALPKLDAAMDQRVDQIAPGRSNQYDINFNPPADPQNLGERINQLRNSNQYANSTSATQKPGIDINPNADRVYLAHEMGHLASQKTDVGNLVSTLRANPKLKNALLASMVGVPVVASALEAGDDDLDTSIALAALANAPTLVDEGLASKNALAIMDTADMRASLGQRGKLAAGLLSYAALPILAGAAGNAVGNQLDQDI